MLAASSSLSPDFLWNCFELAGSPSQAHLGEKVAATEARALETLVLQYHRDRGAALSEQTVPCPGSECCFVRRSARARVAGDVLLFSFDARPLKRADGGGTASPRPVSGKQTDGAEPSYISLRTISMHK